MRARFWATCAAGIAVLAGCRHAGPPPGPLPDDWTSLRGPVPAYASLYRLSCCGRRGLLAALRGDERHLSLTVTAPPGKVVVEAWVEDGAGFLNDREASCRMRLGSGELPITREVGLPLSTSVLGALLAGTLPVAARAVPESPGWVEWESDGLWVRALIAGQNPRVTEVRAGRRGEQQMRLRAQLQGPRGALPGQVELEVGGKRARLELLSHRAGVAPPPPSWLDEVPCAEAP
jgi:hypothetical protein